MSDMQEEIKEKIKAYYVANDVDKIIDYITNLQQKIDQYENPEDYTLFYMWLDEKAKDKMKELQEENEKLKDLCDKYEEEHSTTFEYWKHLVKEDYTSRNEKAIEFMKENCDIITFNNGWIIRSELTTTGLGKLFKILNGVDKE